MNIGLSLYGTLLIGGLFLFDVWLGIRLYRKFKQDEKELKNLVNKNKGE